MQKQDNGLFYCKLCLCYHPTSHYHKEPEKPTLKELFNRQQLTGYLETAKTEPLGEY